MFNINSNCIWSLSSITGLLHKHVQVNTKVLNLWHYMPQKCKNIIVYHKAISYQAKKEPGLNFKANMKIINNK